MAKWTDRSNCYGYAVDKTKWLLINNQAYDEALNTLLAANPNWKAVTKSEMVLGKEYVAFRYGQRDFHFMKRNATGHWRHKQGWSQVEAISRKKVFAKRWLVEGSTTFYNSKIHLFEVR